MKIEKRFLTEFNRCYSASHLVVDGQTRLLLATEGEGPCKAWFGPDYGESHEVWEGPGGTMSIVPIPGTNGEFLAVQKFFKMFAWEEAKVVHCYGINTCKGSSDCATASNSCKGQNTCKGQGFKALTEKECKAQGGSLTEPK